MIFGVCLGVDHSELKEIESQHLLPKQALLEVITRWLDTADHAVTWDDILTALRLPALKEEQLAQQIEDNIPQTSGSDYSNYCGQL